MIGHNQPSFDQIAADNVMRGIYMVQLEALIRCVHDPRTTRRHHQVMAQIIQRTNAKTGMAYPGRARLAQDIEYYVNGEAQHYSPATIAKTISELIDFGYVLQDKRAVDGRGRALSHYATRAPSVEDLQAEIAAWCDLIRGRPKREFPTLRVVSDGDTGGNVSGAQLNAVSDDRVSVSEPNDDNRGNVDTGGNVSTGVKADGDTGIRQELDKDLTSKDTPLLALEPDQEPPADAGLRMAFEEFWKAYPPGRKTDKAKAFGLFSKISQSKSKNPYMRATPSELIAGARAFAATRPNPDYTPMPTSWLNKGGWLESGVQNHHLATEIPWWQKPEKVAEMTPQRWERGIAEFATDFWNVTKLGPPPGDKDCLVPESVCRKLNLTEIFDSRGMRRS